MKVLSYAVALLFAFYILNPVVIGQEKAERFDKEKLKAYKTKEFCGGESWNNGDKVSVKELRESTTAATGSLIVDSGRNGGVSVKGENRSDVLVRACVQADRKSVV